MEPTDLTVQILREIRDEVVKTNARLDQTRGELSSRIDQTNARLVESDVRLATAVAGLAGTLTDIKQMLATQLDLRPRVERVEREIE